MVQNVMLLPFVTNPIMSQVYVFLEATLENKFLLWNISDKDKGKENSMKLYVFSSQLKNVPIFFQILFLFPYPLPPCPPQPQMIMKQISEYRSYTVFQYLS